MKEHMCYLAAVIINTQGEVGDIARWYVGDDTRRAAVVDVVFFLGF